MRATKQYAPRHRHRSALLLPALAVLALLAGCKDDGGAKRKGGGSGEPAAPVLRFSAIPDQNKTELKEKFDAIADYLSEQLEVDVEYVAASDYKASVELFKNGDIQLAWFGGLTGVQARQAVPGARAIAQGKADPQYKSYFIAHKDTGLTRGDAFPAGIAEFPFTFGSESSTSGRLMPEFFIRQATGKAPADFFKEEPGFSGSHDKTVELVEAGKVKVGAVNYKVYDKRVASGKTDPEVCRIIWVTPFYADYNFTAHPDLETKFGADFTDKLQAALIAMSGDLLQAFPREAMIPATNEDFDGIVEVARDLGFLR